MLCHVILLPAINTKSKNQTASRAGAIVVVKESVVEKELRMRVQLAGGLCIKTRAIGTRGFFDRVIVLPGRVVFCEVKRPRGGRVSPHQIRYHKMFVALGVEACFVRNSGDIDRLLSAT
jgi:hypothetical protein